METETFPTCAGCGAHLAARSAGRLFWRTYRVCRDCFDCTAVELADRIGVA